MDKNKSKGLFKLILPWISILLMFAIVMNFTGGNSSQVVNYSEFMDYLDNKDITEVAITPNGDVAGVEGIYVEKVTNNKGNTEEKKTKFEVVIPNTELEIDSLVKLLEDNNIKVAVVDNSNDGALLRMLMSILPYVLLFGGMYFIFTKMNSVGGSNNKAFEFGNSRAKLEKNQKTRFSDVAGADEEKEELKELVEFLKNPKRFASMGARIPKGVLLVGPPGTGKTLLARSVAGEANVPFYTISGSEFVEMFVGVGAGRVRDMFKKAKQTAPCIIFIDEIDAVGRQRGAGLGGGHDEREQTLNQLLVEMDGFEGNEGIIILAATNRADVLDPALLRPGRFDRQIMVSNPDRKARAEILKVHARNKRFASDVNFDNVAGRTPGFSGAELENVLNEAALLAVRLNRTLITMEDIDEAIDRVIGGPAKKSRKYTEKERRLVAYHEAGHAILGLALEDANKVQKVTIIPRGNAGGYNLMTPKEETYFQTKGQIMASIAGLMGGRVAEEIFFGDITSGAQNDIEQATRLARKMVTEWGMSDLGPIKYDSGEGAVFLGRDYSQTSNQHSGQIAFEIDQQVRAIIDQCHSDATRIITENKDKLELIAKSLLEYETLANEQIESLYKDGVMPLVSGKNMDVEPKVEPTVEIKETKEVEPLEEVDDLLDEMK